MVKIRQNLMPSSLYSWKSPYPMNPTRIAVHNTANDASADAEIEYMNKSQAQGGRQTSFHYAVDDIEAVQGLPENRNGWHAGDGNGKGNRESIGIEICYSESGGERFIKAEQNAVELIVDILKRYGWGIDKVTKHQDYSGKYCPHRTLDMGWERFINMIKAKLNDSTPQTSTSQSFTPYLVKINSDDGFLNVRDGAGMNYKVNTTVKNGEVFTIVGKSGDWGKLKSGAGYIYLPLTKRLDSAAATQPTINYYPKCSSYHNSIVNALKEIGVNSAFSNRKNIAIKNGISNYTGTPAQNIDLLNRLKQGKLIK